MKERRNTRNQREEEIKQPKKKYFYYYKKQKESKSQKLSGKNAKKNIHTEPKKIRMLCIYLSISIFTCILLYIEITNNGSTAAAPAELV